MNIAADRFGENTTSALSALLTLKLLQFVPHQQPTCIVPLIKKGTLPTLTAVMARKLSLRDLPQQAI